MKVLVVLVAACMASAQANYGAGYSGPLASPVVTPQGFLADTPEVAAAKAAHLTEYAKAGSPAGYAPGPYNGAPAYNPGYSGPASPAYPVAPAAPAYNNYYGSTSLTPEGFLADTPEIAAAKAAHFAEKAKIKSNPNDDGSYKPEYDSPAPAYSGYSAPPTASYSGYSAPAAQPYSGYSAPAAPAYSGYSAPAPQAYSGYSAPSSYSAPATSYQGATYSGPLASPVVTPQGFLADTPEVAAAKNAHLAEYSKTSAPSHGHGRYRRSAAVLVQTPASTTPLALAYPAPYAYPHSYGYVAPYAYAPSAYSYAVRAW